tara:strand:+ start:2431 stop:3051 length:621 start_codon:yes stop_codon:yes gene_type:complete
VSQEIIILPSDKSIDWMLFLTKKIKNTPYHNIEIDCLDWKIRCKEIIEIKNLFKIYNRNIVNIKSTSIETIISAKSLGLAAYLYEVDSPNKQSNFSKNLKFHKGTVRSGENIESKGDLLILGDVNPGGMVSANGDVMIWGRLLGIAHAGKFGNMQAKISALHLRPVQLRIADKVAKGPDEIQVIGVAEQAELISGEIVINPLTLKK